MRVNLDDIARALAKSKLIEDCPSDIRASKVWCETWCMCTRDCVSCWLFVGHPMDTVYKVTYFHATNEWQITRVLCGDVECYNCHGVEEPEPRTDKDKLLVWTGDFCCKHSNKEKSE